ncbi:MAG: hypothetical protein ABIQ95_07235 [Bdellovibrionia bacterium]
MINAQLLVQTVSRTFVLAKTAIAVKEEVASTESAPPRIIRATQLDNLNFSVTAAETTAVTDSNHSLVS